MSEKCDHCGCEINDQTEFCPGCNANIRAERAERQCKILEEAIEGWRSIKEIEKNTIYLVIAYRWGDKCSYSYVVGWDYDQEAAKELAKIENDYRGGKYACSVIEVNRVI